MVWILLDANALIDYLRERALRDLGKDPTSHKANVLRVRLERERHVLAANTAYGEARHNLHKDLVHTLGDSNADPVMDRAVRLLHNYRGGSVRADNLEHVRAVQDMYAEISDPGNRAFVKWKKKKGMFVIDPVLGSDPNDIKILSTAVHYAQQHETELWTRDMDFTMFAGEILSTLGVRVVNTYRL